MFGFRTPAKSAAATSELLAPPPEKLENVGPSQSSLVRRSIGEWESGMVEKRLKSPTSAPLVASVAPPKPKAKAAPVQETKTAARRTSTEAMGSPPKGPSYSSRVAEARACLNKAKLNLGNSRNLRSDIKAAVTQAIERLYQIVKEIEAEREDGEEKKDGKEKQRVVETEKKDEKKDKKTDDKKDEKKDEEVNRKGKEKTERFEKLLTEQGKLIKDNNERMEALKATMEKQSQALERVTYANVLAGNTIRRKPEQAALHSVVITSRDEEEKTEEVLAHVRKAMNAKEGWVKIERVRKAKDSKIILGCKTKEEREKVKEKLKGASDMLVVEDIQNKDPLLVLKGVLSYNSDEDIIKGLRNQNRDLFVGLTEKDDRLEVRFRRKARNPHVGHVVMRVSPAIWQRAVDAGAVHIDLQTVIVEDYSPLVQCSMCLGYGHGRRFCKETVVKCSHCGGPHMKSGCANWLASVTPSCSNCVSAKLDTTDHNAFSRECPVRRQWDALARASIAYC